MRATEIITEDIRVRDTDYVRVTPRVPPTIYNSSTASTDIDSSTVYITAHPRVQKAVLKEAFERAVSRLGEDAPLDEYMDYVLEHIKASGIIIGRNS